MDFKSKHNLLFEIASSPYNFLGNHPHSIFRVGTCEGQWGVTHDSYFIISVVNSDKGNGHLEDVFEWFENSCKRDSKNLMVLEIMNKDFYAHLTSKRGFTPMDKDGRNLIKVFDKKKYKKLIRNGNEMINKNTLTCI